jgi:3',5'-cyclic AMP phosphodiesterase CpdA
MFRIAHISDVHLGPLPKVSLRQLASKRITGYVNWQRNRRRRHGGNALDLLIDEIQTQAPDHLAITGDLVNLSTDLEIEAARLWLESVGDPASVSVIPGNHDAYVPGAFSRVCNAWAPYMRGDDGKGIPDAGTFPYLRVRDRVAIIGVSTANATLPFMATGLFDRQEAKRLTKLLSQSADAGLFRVILIHHPPVEKAASWHKRLVGMSRFQEVIAEGGAELILHGHTHLDTLHWIKGADNRVPVLGVSSASEGLQGKKPASGFNMISIGRERDDWKMHIERYRLHSDGTKIAKLNDVDLTLGG